MAPNGKTPGSRWNSVVHGKRVADQAGFAMAGPGSEDIADRTIGNKARARVVSRDATSLRRAGGLTGDPSGRKCVSSFDPEA